MQETKIRFIKLDPKAQMPTYGSEFAAGADLYAVLEKEITIEPGQTVMIGTGIACEIPIGFAGLIYARSGLACKKGLAPANKVGVVDSDYRGEIKIALHNHGTDAQVVGTGERIAQLVITPFLRAVFEEAETLEETDRGEGGFGSSGRF
ncbi:MAG: dUTP diphosphatase [Clostridiales bacterium]|nr:dUTP diphosphatase [Clostridiales bacterium]